MNTNKGKMLGRNKDTGKLALYDNISSDSMQYLTRKIIRTRENRWWRKDAVDNDN